MKEQHQNPPMIYGPGYCPKHTKTRSFTHFTSTGGFLMGSKSSNDTNRPTTRALLGVAQCPPGWRFQYGCGLIRSVCGRACFYGVVRPGDWPVCVGTPCALYCDLPPVRGRFGNVPAPLQSGSWKCLLSAQFRYNVFL